MNLQCLRKTIDSIDDKILKLLNQRAKEVIKISTLKSMHSLDAYSPEREANILHRLKRTNRGPLSSDDIDILFREILSVSRSLRSVLRIAYLGPQGTFTHLAAVKKFGKKSKYVFADTISEVFEKTEKGDVDYGVVPVENSIEGVVNYTLDMFLTSALKICSEITLNISHCLLGSSARAVKQLYSNPQVFAQCRKWISQNLAGVELISTSSTAKAAILAKKDKHGVCIGNKILADLYGLKILASSIEDSPHNYTRFLVIAKSDSPASGKDKTSILFSIKDRVGALHDILSSFKKYNINLTKIESRPSRRKAWDYYFFVDFEGHRSSPIVQKALREVERGATFVKVLGSYPKES